MGNYLTSVEEYDSRLAHESAFCVRTRWGPRISRQRIERTIVGLRGLKMLSEDRRGLKMGQSCLPEVLRRWRGDCSFGARPVSKPSSGGHEGTYQAVLIPKHMPCKQTREASREKWACIPKIGTLLIAPDN